MVAVVIAIAVTAAVTVPVLLVVGSVLSTQNGEYACLRSYVVMLKVYSHICYSMVLMYPPDLVEPVGLLQPWLDQILRLLSTYVYA